MAAGRITNIPTKQHHQPTHLIAQVLDDDLVAALVQQRKAVARQEHGGSREAALGLLRVICRGSSGVKIVRLQSGYQPKAKVKLM